MALRPYTNTGKHDVHIGGKRIAPGDTREVDETLIPGHTPAAAPTPEPGDPVLELLDQSVPNIKKALPGLDDDQLARLEQAEVNGNTRSTLMEALEEEKLRRATEPDSE